METTTKTIDISKLSADEIEEILKQKRAEEQDKSRIRREAYQGIRAETATKIHSKVKEVVFDVKELFTFVQGEATAFYDVMKEYGQLVRDGQLSFKIEECNFRMEVKTQKVKKFDERADIAAAKLIDYLGGWISKSQKGTNDPMYQLAMTLLERNQNGDLDYKSVSKLYELESEFNDPEYSDIMQLFKESNVVEGTATNYYFYEKNARGVWIKLEPNFNRM